MGAETEAEQVDVAHRRALANEEVDEFRDEQAHEASVARRAHIKRRPGQLAPIHADDVVLSHRQVRCPAVRDANGRKYEKMRMKQLATFPFVGAAYRYAPD